MGRSLQVNRAHWDERAGPHAASPDYAVQEFVRDPSFLSRVVQFDRPRLGDIRGVRAIHLQCHIGTDTVSLARLGAHMTGLDFSPEALAHARTIAARAGHSDIRFVEAEVDDALRAVGDARFDLVFTGIGALCWLPSVTRWARVVSDLLVPGGRLFLREGHPMLWAIDEDQADALIVDYPYFETPDPVVFDIPGSYVETDTTFRHTLHHTWNHGLGEIVTALLDAGMSITGLVEHDSVPWEALPGRMRQVELGEWRLADRPWRLPHSYTLQAVKSVTP